MAGAFLFQGCSEAQASSQSLAMVREPIAGSPFAFTVAPAAAAATRSELRPCTGAEVCGGAEARVGAAAGAGAATGPCMRTCASMSWEPDAGGALGGGVDGFVGGVASGKIGGP